MIFDTSDLDHLHDVVYDLTGDSKDPEELLKIAEDLPDHIKIMIEEYGMNDTEVRETIRAHLDNE